MGSSIAAVADTIVNGLCPRILTENTSTTGILPTLLPGLLRLVFLETQNFVKTACL